MNTICKNCEAENSLDARFCSKCGYELTHQVNNSNDQQLANSEKPKTDNKKKIVNAVVSVVVFFLSYFLVQHFMFGDSKIDKELTKTSNEINKNCPILVDKDTQLDGTVALPNKIIQYNYTLINFYKEEINIEDVKKFVFDNSLNNIKENPDMSLMKKNKVTLRYSYKDKNGVFLFTTEVKPKDYEN